MHRLTLETTKRKPSESLAELDQSGNEETLLGQIMLARKELVEAATYIDIYIYIYIDIYRYIYKCIDIYIDIYI